METETRLIYRGRDKLLEKELISLENDTLSDQDKELIKQWHGSLLAGRSHELRVAKLSGQLRLIAHQLPQGLALIEEPHIDRLVASINTNSKWSEATRADYRRCLKQFYSWYKEQDPRVEDGDKKTLKLYKRIEGTSTAYKEKSFDYSEIITEEELDQLVSAAKNSMHKAFVSVLHESGFRIGEMLNMHLKDIEFGQDRLIIRVDGKTGTRRVPLVRCMGSVSRWLEEHPRKEDRNSYVWLGEAHWEPALNKTVENQPLRYTGAVKLLQRLFERAELHKQKNLHWLRHSRATINAQWMTEQMLCLYFGWTPGSKQVRRYCHCNVTQLENVVMEMNGLKKPEDAKKELQKCTCGIINTPEARYCARCGKPLSTKVIFEDEDRKKEAINEAFGYLSKILADPEARAQFESFQQKQSKVRP